MCNTTREAASLAFTTDAVVLAVDATKGQIVAGADSERRSVTVINDPDNANTVYVVPSSSSGQSTGLKLKPGASYTLLTIAPVYVIAAAGGLVYVVTETGAKL